MENIEGLQETIKGHELTAKYLVRHIDSIREQLDNADIMDKRMLLKILEDGVMNWIVSQSIIDRATKILNNRINILLK